MSSISKIRIINVIKEDLILWVVGARRVAAGKWRPMVGKLHPTDTAVDTSKNNNLCLFFSYVI